MPSLCIHGHFYQPPRFDPWLDEVLPESSAAPFHNWNQRISRECYEPLAFARRMDSRGFIFNIINCYEYISFNFGPTLLTWMEKHSPNTYERVLEGDRLSIEKYGRGNAMAQVYHHVIMPLSTEHDRSIEIQWSIHDFEYRYGRRPEGMWLAETAVCTNTLESLARAGIEFTILAPRQARAVARIDSDHWQEVDETTLDTDQPYLVLLPSGRKISVFFYDGPASQAVAFERLLSNGQEFWQRLIRRSGRPLLSLATDG
ncbi:MAG: glycoside hydrolase, partial [Desulfonatronovibrionaceae bacterium]